MKQLEAPVPQRDDFYAFGGYFAAIGLWVRGVYQGRIADSWLLLDRVLRFDGGDMHSVAFGAVKARGIIFGADERIAPILGRMIPDEMHNSVMDAREAGMQIYRVVSEVVREMICDNSDAVVKLRHKLPVDIQLWIQEGGDELMHEAVGNLALWMFDERDYGEFLDE